MNNVINDSNREEWKIVRIFLKYTWPFNNMGLMGLWPLNCIAPLIHGFFFPNKYSVNPCCPRFHIHQFSCSIFYPHLAICGWRRLTVRIVLCCYLHKGLCATMDFGICGEFWEQPPKDTGRWLLLNFGGVKLIHEFSTVWRVNPLTLTLFRSQLYIQDSSFLII